MTDDPRLSEEMTAGDARLRIDVLGGDPREHVLDDMSFLNYRLADVRIAPSVSLAEPDIVWRQDGDKAIAYDGRRMTFTGPWPGVHLPSTSGRSGPVRVAPSADGAAELARTVLRSKGVEDI